MKTPRPRDCVAPQACGSGFLSPRLRQRDLTRPSARHSTPTQGSQLMSQRPPIPVLYLLSTLSLVAVSGCFAHRNAHDFCEICPGMPIGEQFVQGTVVLPHGIPGHGEPTPAPAPSGTTQPPLVPPPAPVPQSQPAPANTSPMPPKPQAPPEPQAGKTEPRRVVSSPGIPTSPQAGVAAPYPEFSGPPIGYGQTWIESEMPRDSLLRRVGRSLGHALSRLKPNRGGTAVVDPWQYSNSQQVWSGPSVPLQTITPAPGATQTAGPTAHAEPSTVTTQRPQPGQATHPYAGYRASSRVSQATSYPPTSAQPIGGFWNQR